MEDLGKIRNMAEEIGREYWLDETSSNKGWYTCVLTGKKFRGTKAKQMIEEQREYELEEEAKLIKQEIIIEQADEDNILEYKPLVNISKDTLKPIPVVHVIHQSNDQIIEAVRTKILDIRLEIEQRAKTTIIYCEDCGIAREIKIQDKFQVRRCPECQREYRNMIRRLRRR